MKDRPSWAVPYRYKKVRLLKVPEVGDKQNQCKGCVREEEGMGWEWAGLCELRGKNDCQPMDMNGDAIDCESVIFIKNTKAAIAEYLARRMGV